jgi:putative ABC transport system ATP-binding protein
VTVIVPIRAEIMAILQRLNGGGITVVRVTHEDDIARHASRVITFRDGRVWADTPVANPTDAEAELATRVEETVA